MTNKNKLGMKEQTNEAESKLATRQNINKKLEI